MDFYKLTFNEVGGRRQAATEKSLQARKKMSTSNTDFPFSLFPHSSQDLRILQTCEFLLGRLSALFPACRSSGSLREM